MFSFKNRYFVSSDYDLTLRLQALFNETVSLQDKFDRAEMKQERIELALKLKEVHGEISRLVKDMKHLLSDTEIKKHPAKISLSTSKRNQ